MKYLQLLRMKHYIKNLLILLPFFFSGLFLNLDNNYLRLTLAFIAFCCVSSIVYIFNDIVDRNKDKLHPQKKNRPIASGAVSLVEAVVLVTILSIIVVGLMLYLNSCVITILLATYCLLNILYSLFFKNMVIIDIIVLSSFFLIRVYFGALIIDVPVSVYLFLTVFSMAFMMGADKRKKEMLVSESCRGTLSKYSYGYLNGISQMFMILTVVFYSLWIISGTNHLINNIVIQMSIILVIAILLYYQYIVETSKDGDPVGVIFKNSIIVLLIIGYLVLMLFGFVINSSI